MDLLSDHYCEIKSLVFLTNILDLTRNVGCLMKQVKKADTSILHKWISGPTYIINTLLSSQKGEIPIY